MYLGLGESKNGEGEGGLGDDDASTLIGRLTDKESIVLDFHYYNYAFCKERRFDARATSTFLSIMKDVLDEVKSCLRCLLVARTTLLLTDWRYTAPALKQETAILVRARFLI